MITLDEAIEKERKQVEMYRCEYECECDYYDKCFVDDHADEFECIKNMHEHEQLLDWLEELKVLRTTSCGYSKEDIELNRYAMYNKAIDDFVKEICKMIVQSENNGNYRFYAVEIKQAIADLAEQLKENNVK